MAKTRPSQEPARDHGPVAKRQLIHAMHHNMCKYHPDWFKKGECVLVTEKLTYADGHVEKRMIRVEDPKIVYHVTAEAHRERQKNQEAFFPLELCDEYESRSAQIDRDVAMLTDQMDFFRETAGPGQNMRRRKLHDHRWLHGSDVEIVDHHIDRYVEKFGPILDTASPLDFAVADIEVDGVDHRGFPEEDEAPCPVNLISYFGRADAVLTQFILRRSVRDNPQITKFEASQPAMSRRILAEVNRRPLEKAGLVGEDLGWEATAELLDRSPEARALMRCRESRFRFFDTEQELILGFLRFVNEEARPDALGWWNQRFDIVTLMNRLRGMRIDPAKAFSSSEAGPWVYADYKDDTFNTQESDRNDVFLCAAPTIYVDLMLLYASLRKQDKKKSSYSLDFTLSEELEENKLEYEGKLPDLPYRDFARFVSYAAVDVVPLVTMENQNDDVALAYRISMLTRTRFHKVMKKTVCLRNLFAVGLRRQGYAISNNHNRNADRVEGEKFQGGFAADPMLMNYSGIEVGGVRSNRVYDGVVDLDATSLYPSLILMCNIDPASQIGRLLLMQEDGSEADSSEFVMTVAGGDAVEMGARWFGLPDLGELAGAVLGMENLLAPGELLPEAPDDHGEEEPDEVELRVGAEPEAAPETEAANG